MSEAARRHDAFRSALERLPVSVLVVDGQNRLQPYNKRATELFAREGLSGDLLASRPSHPLSIVVSEILKGRAMEEQEVTFPSGARYRVAPSRQSPKGIGRWLMLLVSDGSTAPCVEAFDFTPREREVADQLLDGNTTEEICSKLQISRDTVKSHMKRLFEKTGARNRAEFISKLLRPR